MEEDSEGEEELLAAVDHLSLNDEGEEFFESEEEENASRESDDRLLSFSHFQRSDSEDSEELLLPHQGTPFTISDFIPESPSPPAPNLEEEEEGEEQYFQHPPTGPALYFLALHSIHFM